MILIDGIIVLAILSALTWLITRWLGNRARVRQDREKREIQQEAHRQKIELLTAQKDLVGLLILDRDLAGQVYVELERQIQESPEAQAAVQRARSR